MTEVKAGLAKVTQKVESIESQVKALTTQAPASSSSSVYASASASYSYGSGGNNIRASGIVESGIIWILVEGVAALLM